MKIKICLEVFPLSGMGRHPLITDSHFLPDAFGVEERPLKVFEGEDLFIGAEEVELGFNEPSVMIDETDCDGELAPTEGLQHAALVSDGPAMVAASKQSGTSEEAAGQRKRKRCTEFDPEDNSNIQLSQILAAQKDIKSLLQQLVESNLRIANSFEKFLAAARK